MRLALIGTFFRRFEQTPRLLERVYTDSTRPPDEFWLMCEDAEDEARARAAVSLPVPGLRIHRLATPRAEGRYRVIPYSHKINWALDRTDADAVVYLDNGSMPSPRKFEVMLRALESHPEWGAVYCSQRRTGFRDEDSLALEVVPDAYCVLNYTQVMHRRTADRWPLEMSYANPDLADAVFWRRLHGSLGPFHPVGPEILDEHHMEGAAAQGLEVTDAR